VLELALCENKYPANIGSPVGEEDRWIFHSPDEVGTVKISDPKNRSANCGLWV
jgi:hypothetical protein